MRCLLGLLLLGITTSAWALHVTIADTATVRHAQVTLGEIAAIDGTPAEQQTVGAIVVDTAPVLSATRRLSAGQVRVYLRQHGIDPGVLTCPETVTLSRAALAVTGASLVAMAQGWLTTQLPAPADPTVTLIPVHTPADVQTPDGVPGFSCTAVGALGGGTNHVLLALTVDGTVCWRGLISFTTGRTAVVLVARAALARGILVGAEQVALERRPVSAAGHPLTALPATPLRTRLPIALGAVLTADDVEPVPVIKRNDRVTVTVECGGIVLMLAGVAGADGGVGDVIPVRNPQTHEEFPARIESATRLTPVR